MEDSCFALYLSVVVLTGLAAALLADSDKDIGLTLLGRYTSGAPSTANTALNPNELAGAEIAAYDPSSRRLFITNAFDNTIDIVSISDPSNPTEVDEINIDPYGAIVNSVAVHNGVVAVAVEAPEDRIGKVAFFNTMAMSSRSSRLARCRTCSRLRLTGARCWSPTKVSPARM